MTAVFPQATKVFTVKRNLLDDVDAGHVNDIQDEIVALQTTIGPLAEVETDLPGGLTRDYGTLKKRLTEIQQGLEKPVAWAYNKAQQIKTSTETSLSLSKALDPYGMISAAGMKLNDDGWWQIKAQCSWDASQKGYRLLIGLANGDELQRDFKGTLSYMNRIMTTKITWDGYLPKNTVLSLKADQNSSTTQRCWDIQLSATFVRRLKASFGSNNLPY